MSRVFTGHAHYWACPLLGTPTTGHAHYWAHPLLGMPTTGHAHYRACPLPGMPTTGHAHSQMEVLRRRKSLYKLSADFYATVPVRWAQSNSLKASSMLYRDRDDPPTPSVQATSSSVQHKSFRGLELLLPVQKTGAKASLVQTGLIKDVGRLALHK